MKKKTIEHLEITEKVLDQVGKVLGFNRFLLVVPFFKKKKGSKHAGNLGCGVAIHNLTKQEMAMFAERIAQTAIEVAPNETMERALGGLGRSLETMVGLTEKIAKKAKVKGKARTNIPRV